MSAELRRAKTRYLNARMKAYQQAEKLHSNIGIKFRVGEWSRSVEDAYSTQWADPRHPDGNFDWPLIFARHKDPDRLAIVIRVDDRICGLGLGTVSGDSVLLRFLEGDHRPDCPLKGMRILIALETAAAYTQALGRKQLRLEPVNQALESLYVDVYGFSVVRPKKGKPHCIKGV